MPSRVQARHKQEEQVIAFRLKASYAPRRFPSPYDAELRNSLAAAASGAPDDIIDSLRCEVLALLPSHAVLFELARQRIGSKADANDVENTLNFCRGAATFRSKLVRPGIAIHVCASTDAERLHKEPSKAGVVIVESNAVAGTFPLSHNNRVLVVCCVCGKHTPFSHHRHQLCACSRQIFCDSCAYSPRMPSHDCVFYDKQARELAATLVLANDTFPFFPLVDESGRIVSIASYRSFLSLAHNDFIRFSVSGLANDSIKQFVVYNTVAIETSFDHAANALHRSASRLMLRSVEELGCKSGMNDRVTMAGVLMHESSAFGGKRVAYRQLG